MCNRKTASRVTVPALRRMKRRGERITMLTAYDATFARLLDQAGVDLLLVGDSLGMVIKGEDNTLSVTLEEVIYHTRAVARGAARAHVVADMPFMSYQTSQEDGIRNAGRLIKEGHAGSVKLEGGQRHADLVRRIVEIGIPVMGHIGLTPQSVHAMGGYKVQGRGKAQAQQLIDDAVVLQQAGAYALVLEAVPAELAAQITDTLDIPTIGIGAGVDCDGQVLVIYDLLGLEDDFKPKFVKRYESFAARARAAVGRYVNDVRSRAFPDLEHSFSRQKRKTASEKSASESDLAETIPLYPGLGGTSGRT